MKNLNLAIFKETLLYCDIKAVKMIILAFNLGFSYVLLTRQDLFNNISVYANFKGMQEWLWGIIFLMASVLIFFNMSTSIKAVKILSVFGSQTLWLVWFGLIVTSPTLGLMTVVSIIMTMLCAWVFFRLMIR